MFKIELDNKEFLALIESTSKVFLELPLEITSEGFKIRNISGNKEVAITMTFDKEDVKSFEYTNKNDLQLTLPFGEFLDAIKKIKVPISIEEDGKSKVVIKGNKISFKIERKKNDPDLYSIHESVRKLHPKSERIGFSINSGDFISAVDLLSFSSGGIKLSIANKILTFESLKGSLTGNYVIENIDLPDDFTWSCSFNSEYMKMLAKISSYSEKLMFYVKQPDNVDDPIPPVVVDIVVAPNSDISVLMAGQKDTDTLPVVAQQDIDEDDDEDDSLEFDDDFYEDEEDI